MICDNLEAAQKQAQANADANHCEWVYFTDISGNPRTEPNRSNHLDGYRSWSGVTYHVVKPASYCAPDPTTGELVIKLASDGEIRSGWVDQDDPDALPCGDWISVNAADGQQLCLLNADDFLSTRCAQEAIHRFIQACAQTS